MCEQHQRATKVDSAAGSIVDLDPRQSHMVCYSVAFGEARGHAYHHRLSRRSNKSSQSHIRFSTSLDPVGAPIFYRDVPLMPTEGANGTAQPLALSAIHLIQWRLRDIRQPESRTVLKEMHTSPIAIRSLPTERQWAWILMALQTTRASTLWSLCSVTFRSRIRTWCSGIQMVEPARLEWASCLRYLPTVNML